MASESKKRKAKHGYIYGDHQLKDKFKLKGYSIFNSAQRKLLKRLLRNMVEEETID